MTDLYPVTFASIPHWAREHNVRADLARMRFAQYAILRAISVTGALQSTLVFKGGNALDFVWQPNRSTTDLDFSIDETSQPFQDDTILAKFQPGLARVSRALQIDLTTHSVERRPPGADRTFATYQLKIGYVLPDEEALRRRVAKGEKSTHVIKLDISLNEPICASISVSIDGTHDLRVSTLEDIVAEKSAPSSNNRFATGAAAKTCSTSPSSSGHSPSTTTRWRTTCCGRPPPGTSRYSVPPSTPLTWRRGRTWAMRSSNKRHACRSSRSRGPP